MAIKRITDKKWEVRISYRDINDPSKVKNIKRRFQTRSEAISFENQYHEGKTEVVNKSITYEQIFLEYINYNRSKANEETINDKIQLAENHLKSLFKKKYFNVNSKDYLDIWINVSKTNLSVSRKNKIITLMRSVSMYAHNYYDYKDNTKTLERFSKTSDDIVPMRVWTPEQFDTFISFVDNEYYKSFFIFAYRTGARRGEIRALLKSDVKNKKVALTKSIRRGVDSISTMKTAGSRRTIALDRVTLDSIELISNYEGQYLFGGLEPLSNSSIQRHFDKAISTANVQLKSDNKEPLPIIRIHDLRHSHASALINNGANIVAVSKRLGHSDIETTLRTYTHLLQKTDDELMSILNKL